MIILTGIQQPVVRAGLRGALRDCFPDAIIEDAGTLEQVRNRLGAGQVDMLVIGLPLSGLALPNDLRRLREKHPGVRLLVLMYQEDRATALLCLAAGVHGFIDHSATMGRLQLAIQAVAASRIYVTQGLLRSPGVDEQSPMPPRQSPVKRELTPRQAEVLHLIREGLGNKEIARRLGLGLGTVKAHLAQVFFTLGAHNRLEAIVKSGLVQVPQSLRVP